jgi:hypothetical protein
VPPIVEPEVPDVPDIAPRPVCDEEPPLRRLWLAVPPCRATLPCALLPLPDIPLEVEDDSVPPMLPCVDVPEPDEVLVCATAATGSNAAKVATMIILRMTFPSQVCAIKPADARRSSTQSC